MIALVFFFSLGIAAPHDTLMRRQSRPDNRTLNRERADAVKAAFVYAWDGYYTYAFPNDELHPVSNTSSNSRYISRLQ
jgi:mannosyl-oligosaccharide alpha-1,2-mannosidase